MKDVMIDLETLGTKPGAPIISIGAVFFDPMTGETGDTYSKVADFESACRYGDPDAATIKWWLGQSEEARKELLRGSDDFGSMMVEFHGFIQDRGYGIRPWGNGATFDISMLEKSFERLNINPPWTFWNIRDVRTVCQLAEGLVDRRDFESKRTGAHKALDDAIHQVRYVSAMFQALRG